MTETERDEMNAKYFYSGWNGALREVRIQVDHGRYDEFMREQRSVFQTLPQVPYSLAPTSTGEEEKR